MLDIEDFNLLTKEERVSYLNEQKRIRGKEDLLYLCHDILGYSEVDKLVHKKLDSVINSKSKRKLILLPRGFFKSTIATIGHTVQLILNNRDIRVLIDSEVLDNAQKFIGQVKKHLRDPKFVELYGDMVSDKHRETAREFTVTGRTVDNLKEGTVSATGVGTVNVGMHYDYIIADDLHSEKNVGTKEQIDKVISHYRLLLSLLEPGGTLIIIGCLVKGTKVLMADGTWKAIEKIRVDEEVKSWDNNGIMVNKRVEAVIPQGKAKVYELRTGNHVIKATGNHPFLTSLKSFKRLDKLKVGDIIIGLDGLVSGESNLTKEEAWALGFMFGDGWITKHPNKKGSMRWATCIAKGVYPELNNKITGFFENKFKTKKLNKQFKFKETKFGYYRTEVAAVGKWLESVGFKGRAKTKRVPDLIYKQNIKTRKAFIDGFVDADGYVDKKGRSNIEICNKLLLEDLKRLLLITGYKSSNIYSRIRENKAPHSKPGQLSESHHISFGKIKRVLPKEFSEYKIESIKELGEEEVWDLTVADTHNFIAEGLVTHNTRWHYYDLYSYILEDEDEKDWETYIEKAIRDDGSLSFPSRLTKTFLQEQRNSQGSYVFSCQYLNSPVSEETQCFKRDYFKYWGGVGDPYPVSDGKRVLLNIYILIDRAFSSKETADYTAVVVVGVSSSNNIYVLDALRKRCGLQELTEIVFRFQTKYGKERVKGIGLETINFEEAFSFFQEQMKKKNRFFILTRLMPGSRQSKNGRIETALASRYANGVIYHRKRMIDFEDELLRFPVGTHDDLIDAFSYITQMMNPPTDPKFELEGIEYQPSGFFGNTGY